MRKRAVSPFTEVRERAWCAAHKWSRSIAGGKLPVALHELAKQLRIRRIEFLPLLSTAGVGPVDDGYVIYINPRAPGAAKVKKKCLELEDQDFSSLNAPLRFTVAHEMAHVLFYDVLGGDCRNELFRKHWRALENSCNQMARVLLVPRGRLLREIGTGLFDVHHLEDVIKRFCVSPELLIYRLQLEDMRDAFQDQDGGLIAYIHKRDSESRVIAAHSLGTLARIRWPIRKWGPDGMALENLWLCVNVGAFFERKEHIRTDGEVFWREGQVAPCTIELKPFHYNPLKALITVRLTGFVQSRKRKSRSRLA